MKTKTLLLFAITAAALLAPNFARADDNDENPASAPARKPSPSLVQIKDTPGLPRVLLIGDSISQGYTLDTRALLKGKANVHRPPTNCGSTASGMANLDKWLATGGSDKWDVIHFNWGLHDLKYLQSGRQNISPEKYEQNLTTLVGKMKKKATTLIFATTTPVAETQSGIYPRKQEDIAKYNEIALRVMKANGVVCIDDLNAVITPRFPDYISKDGVHFNSKGCDALAEAVAESIEKNLPPAAAAGRAKPPAELSASSLATPAPLSEIKTRVTKIEPRIWRCDFDSPALAGRAMRFMVVLPENITPETALKSARRIPVIYFLHGRGRHDRTLLEDATCRARLFASPCAFILPYAREGWYINSPVESDERYADYIDEVIALSARLFPIGNTAATRAIGGWSMGGYGAMLTACRRAGPDGFAAVATVIGLLDFPTPKAVGRYEVPARFGTDETEWAARNPLRLIENLRGVALRIGYATGAPERGMNERFIAAAQAAGFAPEVEKISGGHTFPSVQTLLPGALTFLENAVSTKQTGK